MSINNLTLGLANTPRPEYDQHLTMKPGQTLQSRTVPTEQLSEEELAQLPSFQVSAVLLWADGPVPEGVILPEGADTKRVVLREDGSPVSWASEQEAEAFLGSEEGQRLVQFLGNNSATSVGIRALNAEGVPLWDLDMYSIEPAQAQAQAVSL